METGYSNPHRQNFMAQLEYARRNLLLSLASYIKNLCEYFSRVSDKSLKLSLRVLTLRRTQTVITSVLITSVCA